MDAPRDENRVTAGLGLNDTDGISVLPFFIDSITGRVLISTAELPDIGGVTADDDALRDENFVTTMLCEKSDDSGLGVPAIDHRNGYLYLDLA